MNKDDPTVWFSDQETIEVTPRIAGNTVTIQFWGFEVVLLGNGAYFMNDTSGG